MAKSPKHKGRRPSKDDIAAKAARAEARSKGETVEKPEENGVLNPPTVLPRGRPSKYTEALAAEICDRLSNGETLTTICQDAHMPERRTVLRWRVDIEGFSSRYARAREDQWQLWADELIDISDDARNDWMEKHVGRDETITVVNKEAVDRSKLRADTRKWLLTKLDRSTFGEKIENTHKGDATFLTLLKQMNAPKGS